LEKATFSELATFEVQCPLRGEHVVVPSDPVLFELEDFPSKLIQSPVCSPYCGAPPPTAPAAKCKTYKTYKRCPRSIAATDQSAMPTPIILKFEQAVEPLTGVVEAVPCQPCEPGVVPDPK
jgi:hypothetical protein